MSSGLLVLTCRCRVSFWEMFQLIVFGEEDLYSAVILYKIHSEVL